MTGTGCTWAEWVVGAPSGDPVGCRMGAGAGLAAEDQETVPAGLTFSVPPVVRAP